MMKLPGLMHTFRLCFAQDRPGLMVISDLVTNASCWNTLYEMWIKIFESDAFA